MEKNIIKSTTIVGIRKDNLVVIAGDGQASLGNTVMKSNVKKIRRLGADETVISGFAGSTAMCSPSSKFISGIDSIKTAENS